MAKKKPVSALPAGFVNMGGGDNAPAWKPKEGEVLQGVVTGKKSLDARAIGRKKAKKGETATILTVTDSESGEIVSVWESHALAEVCKAAKVGDEIFLRFNGTKKRPGGKKFNDYTVGLKSKGGKSK